MLLLVVVGWCLDGCCEAEIHLNLGDADLTRSREEDITHTHISPSHVRFPASSRYVDKREHTTHISLSPLFSRFYLGETDEKKKRLHPGSSSAISFSFSLPVCFPRTKSEEKGGKGEDEEENCGEPSKERDARKKIRKGMGEREGGIR